MGCSSVKLKRNGDLNLNGMKCNDKEKHLSDVDSQTLTIGQTAVILNNWRKLKPFLPTIGKHTYLGMFESRPELKDAFQKFKGKNLTELQHTGLIRAHALRVMATVDKCISRLDEPSNLANLMIEMGRHHRQYNVNPDYIQYIATPFINAIKPHIEEYWSDDVEKAWRTLFDLMTYYMTSGMRQTSKNENSFESVT